MLTSLKNTTIVSTLTIIMAAGSVYSANPPQNFEKLSLHTETDTELTRYSEPNTAANTGPELAMRQDTAQQPVSDSRGVGEFSANVDSLMLTFLTLDGDTLANWLQEEPEFTLRIMPGTFELHVSKDGYRDYQEEISIVSDSTTVVTIDMVPDQPETMDEELAADEREAEVTRYDTQQQSFFRKNRWYIAAGGVILTGGAVYLITSSGGDDNGLPGIPLPPGRP